MCVICNGRIAKAWGAKPSGSRRVPLPLKVTLSCRVLERSCLLPREGLCCGWVLELSCLAVRSFVCLFVLSFAIATKALSRVWRKSPSPTRGTYNSDESCELLLCDSSSFRRSTVLSTARTLRASESRSLTVRQTVGRSVDRWVSEWASERASFALLELGRELWWRAWAREARASCAAAS